MMRSAAILMLAVSVSLLTGCVERRYVINSDPPGAVVLRNGQPIGATPVDDHFIYYGKYNFTLIKEGYETQVIEEKIRAPWYEWFPLDFISENLVPYPIVDVRRFNYKLQPRTMPQTQQLINDAQVLRSKGMALEAPPPQPPTAPPPQPPGQP